MNRKRDLVLALFLSALLAAFMGTRPKPPAIAGGSTERTTPPVPTMEFSLTQSGGCFSPGPFHFNLSNKSGRFLYTASIEWQQLLEPAMNGCERVQGELSPRQATEFFEELRDHGVWHLENHDQGIGPDTTEVTIRLGDARFSAAGCWLNADFLQYIENDGPVGRARKRLFEQQRRKVVRADTQAPPRP